LLVGGVRDLVGSQLAGRRDDRDRRKLVAARGNKVDDSGGPIAGRENAPDFRPCAP
jgi:hypothetical protein